MVRRTWLVLLVAFALSVVVRSPHLGRPLGAHHEFCTAVALIVMHNWWVDGFATHHGAPVQSFTGAADRYPMALFDGPAVHDGVLYYFSHPPLAYDLPYGVFSLLGIPPGVLGLQAINVLFHLLAACGLFLAGRAVWPTGRAPLFAAVLYLFMPAPLWFHGNAYMSDMFVQNFWLMHLAVAVPVFIGTGPPAMARKLTLAFTLFLTVYTSWMGVFAGCAAAGCALWYGYRQRDRRWSWLAAWCMAAIGLALGITFWRYAGVADASSLWAYYASRLEVRGSVGMEEDVWTHLGRLAVNYRMGFLPVIVLVPIVWSLRRKALPGVSPHMKVLLLLTGLPVLLDHLFLLQYADHDFAVLKAGPFLCCLAGRVLAALPVQWSRLGLLATCLAGVLYYYRLNPLPTGEGEALGQARDLGSAIAQVAGPDEPVFTMGFTPEPQVWWYAKRTLFRVDSLPQVQEHLRLTGFSSAVVFGREGGGVQVPYVPR